MKKVKNSLCVGILFTFFAGFISCGTGEEATTKTTDQSSAIAIKKAETLEMKNFKEALIQLQQDRASKQRDAIKGKMTVTTSLFNEKNENLILDSAKQLILASGYSAANLPNSNRAIIMMAMKVYAEKTQIISNN